MFKHRYQTALTLALISSVGLSFRPPASESAELNTQGGKGAKVYCYMRSNGNHHEVSWKASYALLKRQSNSMFKTSPKHAAVMITEAVVQEPDKYPDCGRFIGDLFGSGKKKELEETLTPEPTTQASAEDRYTY